MFSNIDCMNFKDNLTQLINSCGLSPVVAYFILKDTLRELQNVCQQILNKQAKEKEEKRIEGHMNLQTGEIEEHEKEEV